MSDEASLMRLLAEHAIACWTSEETAIAHSGNLVLGRKHRALYYRTRAVVLYDRARDEINGIRRRVDGLLMPEQREAQ